MGQRMAQEPCGDTADIPVAHGRPCFPSYERKLNVSGLVTFDKPTDHGLYGGGALAGANAAAFFPVCIVSLATSGKGPGISVNKNVLISSITEFFPGDGVFEFICK
jgi:hypothetical protein